MTMPNASSNHPASSLRVGFYCASYRGLAGFRKYVSTWSEVFGSDLRVTPMKLIDFGDRVVSLADLQARGQASGLPFTGTIATVSVLKDGGRRAAYRLAKTTRKPSPKRRAVGVGHVAGEPSKWSSARLKSGIPATTPAPSNPSRRTWRTMTTSDAARRWRASTTATPKRGSSGRTITAVVRRSPICNGSSDGARRRRARRLDIFPHCAAPAAAPWRTHPRSSSTELGKRQFFWTGDQLRPSCVWGCRSSRALVGLFA